MCWDVSKLWESNLHSKLMKNPSMKLHPDAPVRRNRDYSKVLIKNIIAYWHKRDFTTLERPTAIKCFQWAETTTKEIACLKLTISCSQHFRLTVSLHTFLEFAATSRYVSLLLIMTYEVANRGSNKCYIFDIYRQSSLLGLKRPEHRTHVAMCAVE